MKYIDTSYSGLRERLEDDSKIYCFGAGKIFNDCYSKLKEFGLEEIIEACVDNYKEGVLNTIGRKLRIIDVKELTKVIDEKDYLIITTKYYEEIIDQLTRVDSLKRIRYSLYFVLRGRELDIKREEKSSYLVKSTDVECIPRIIHYCWFGHNPISSDYLECMKSWEKYCPDYKIIKWDEDNYDIGKNQYLLEAYQNKKWAFVSDYVRLDVIYNYGGIYLDTDVELKKNIDQLLWNEAFCGFQSSKEIAFGLGFGAVKNNSIIGEVMDYYNHRHFVNNGELDMTPCPIVQTEILKKHGLVLNGEYQLIDGFAVYPEVVLCGISPYTGLEISDLSNTYMSHHFLASWAPQYRNNKNKLKEYFI